MVLNIYYEMKKVMETGKPYQTILIYQAADLKVAHNLRGK